MNDQLLRVVTHLQRNNYVHRRSALALLVVMVVTEVFDTNVTISV